MKKFNERKKSHFTKIYFYPIAHESKGKDFLLMDFQRF